MQDAIERLDHQSRIHEIGPREERLTAIANEYVKDSHATLAVSPDNQSRQDLNDAMQREGHVGRDEHRIIGHQLQAVTTQQRAASTRQGSSTYNRARHRCHRA